MWASLPQLLFGGRLVVKSCLSGGTRGRSGCVGRVAVGLESGRGRMKTVEMTKRPPAGKGGCSPVSLCAVLKLKPW